MMDTKTIICQDKNDANNLLAFACVAMAKMILESPAAQFLGAVSRRNLEFLVDGDVNVDYSCRLNIFSFVSTPGDDKDAWDGDTDFAIDWVTFGPKSEYRDDGSQWRQYTLKLEVSWSSHGLADFKVAAHRVAVYAAICDLAARIEAAMPAEIVFCAETKEQVEARRTKEREEQNNRAIDRRIRDIVETFKQGMRVGSKRDVSPSIVDGIPAGKKLDVRLEEGKSVRYYQFVRTPTFAVVTRTALVVYLA